MCLLMGHTAKFTVKLSISSGIVSKEPPEHHEFVGPYNLEIH